MDKSNEGKQMVVVGPGRDNSPGFLRQVSILAALAVQSKKFDGLLTRHPFGNNTRSHLSKKGRYNRETRGAFGSPGGSETRLGGYSFHPRVGLRSLYL